VLKRGVVAKEFNEKADLLGHESPRTVSAAGKQRGEGVGVLIALTNVAVPLYMTIATETARPFEQAVFAEQMRNIAPVLTLIVLVIFFSTRRRASAPSTI
jgi:hypothetical protein